MAASEELLGLLHEAVADDLLRQLQGKDENGEAVDVSPQVIVVEAAVGVWNG